jgi:hypothetical protein
LCHSLFPYAVIRLHSYTVLLSKIDCKDYRRWYAADAAASRVVSLWFEFVKLVNPRRNILSMIFRHFQCDAYFGVNFCGPAAANAPEFL